MSHIQNYPKFSHTYCFGNVILFLTTPKDFEVLRRISKQFTASFLAECAEIRLEAHKFVAVDSRNSDLSIVPNFPCLRELDISRTSMDARRLGDMGYSYLRHLTALRILRCRNGTITANSLSYFPTTLQELDLARLRMEGELSPDAFRPLQQMSSLTKLNLYDCCSDFSSDEYISFFPDSLQALCLMECSISTNEVDSLKRLTDLRELDLRQTFIKDDDVSDLCSALTKLSTLSLGSGGRYTEQLTDVCLDTLPQTLQCLTIDQADITRVGIAFLQPNRLPNLQSLSMHSCNLLKDEDLPYLPPMLRHLDISYCREITDAGIPHLPRGLEHLAIRGRSRITGATFSSLPPTLRILDAGRCGVKDAVFQDLPETIEELDLSYSKITNFGLGYLRPPLVITSENVSILFLKKIPLGLLYAAPKGLPNLRRLNISYCELVTDQGLIYLPKLEYLNIIGCKRITKVAVQVYVDKYQKEPKVVKKYS